MVLLRIHGQGRPSEMGKSWRREGMKKGTRAGAHAPFMIMILRFS